MRKLLYILILCCVPICCGQNIVVTFAGGDAQYKSEISSLKVLLEVYGDSITNGLLMREINLPGIISLEYNNETLELDTVKFVGDGWRSVSDAFKRRMVNAIKKQTYYWWGEWREVKQLKEDFAQAGYVGLAAFTPKCGFFCLWPYGAKIDSLRNGKIIGNYKAVDYAKKRIAEVDSIYVKDINGKLWR